MTSMYRRPFKLLSKVQHYDWGTRNAAAFIPSFLGIPAEKDRPYAELWIGAHPTAPSEILLNGQAVPLTKAIESAPREILGDDVARRFGGKLPFLLKVLSAGAPLSIQTHPNKEQARRLHAKDPAHYPDDNHKPEIAIALDGLTAIAGFRPVEDLVAVLTEYPELGDLVGYGLVASVLGGTNDADREKRLREVYEAIMRREGDDGALASVTAKIVARLSAMPSLSIEQRYFVEQYRVHKADVGLFSFLLFNLLQLKPGQAIFTDAGIPHAYLKGNIVECMANSDNVVRAGLTGKFKDVDALLEILDYRFARYEILNLEQRTDGVVYRTIAKEFEVTSYSKPSGCDLSMETGGSPVVVLVTDGFMTVKWPATEREEADTFSQGEAFLIPAALDRWRAFTAARVAFYSVAIPKKTGS
jgi:mannose-6-phosphate isomerase